MIFCVHLVSKNIIEDNPEISSNNQAGRILCETVSEISERGRRRDGIGKKRDKYPASCKILTLL